MIFDNLDIPPAIWVASAGPAREESMQMRGLLVFPRSNPVTDPFSPIFYPNQVQDHNFLFFNEYQPKVCGDDCSTNPNTDMHMIGYTCSSIQQAVFDDDSGYIFQLQPITSGDDLGCEVC